MQRLFIGAGLGFGLGPQVGKYLTRRGGFRGFAAVRGRARKSSALRSRMHRERTPRLDRGRHKNAHRTRRTPKDAPTHAPRSLSRLRGGPQQSSEFQSQLEGSGLRTGQPDRRPTSVAQVLGLLTSVTTLLLLRTPEGPAAKPREREASPGLWYSVRAVAGNPKLRLLCLARLLQASAISVMLSARRARGFERSTCHRRVHSDRVSGTARASSAGEHSAASPEEGPRRRSTMSLFVVQACGEPKERLADLFSFLSSVFVAVQVRADHRPGQRMP